MATANILGVVTSSETTNTTTHTVELPTGVAVGDWVVVVVAEQQNIVFFPVTWPDGWVVNLLDGDNGTTIQGAVLVHECNGLEDWFGSASPTITYTTTNDNVSAHIAIRASAGGVFVQVGTVDTSDNPDPPAAQALWLDNEASVDVVAVAGFVAQDISTFSVSVYPTGYADDQTFVIDDNGTKWLAVGIAADDVTATGDVNPGTFTLSNVDAQYAFTILLFPAPDFQTFAHPSTGLVDVSVQVGITEELMVGYPIRWVEVDHLDIREFSTRRGRQQELDVMEASTATLLLDNNDGNWTPTNTAGAYYPWVRPMMPVRIAARSNDVTHFRFTGYLERLPLATAGGREDHVLRATAVDALKVFGLRSVTSRAAVVEAAGPVAWWRMSDDATDDSSTGATHTLTWNGTPDTGHAGVWQGDEALILDGTNDYATVASEADLELLADMSIEAWFKPTDDSEPFQVLIACRGATSSEGSIYELLWTPSELMMFAPTTAEGVFITTAGGVGGDAPVGEWSHVVLTIDWSGTDRIVTIWSNGVRVLNQTYAFQPGAATRAVEIGRRPGTATWHFGGSISEIAFYDRVLTPTEITGLHNAQFDTWPVMLSSARVSRLLDDVGWIPRHIRAGQTSMQVAPLGADVRADFDVAAVTEFGQFFINGQGVAVFHDRHYRPLVQSASVATFTTTDGGGVHYAEVVIGTDDNELWTEVAVTPGTVDNTSTDAAPTAVARSDNHTLYGVRTLPLTTYPNDRDEALDMAQHLLSVYENPNQHVEQVAFNLGYTQTEVSTLLGAELGNRYTVTRALPGDDFSDDVYLEAIEDRVSPAGWQIGFWLSPAVGQGFAVLDDAVLGVLDDPACKLGF